MTEPPRRWGAAAAVAGGAMLIAGAALIAIVFVGPKTAWGWVGLVPLVTGLVGNCPVYTLLGIATCKIKS